MQARSNAIGFGRCPRCSMLTPSTDSGSAMELVWFGRPKISVRVLGPDIIVTMPGTSFRVMYTKTEDNKLVASGFSARKLVNEECQVSFPHFLALAWPAANDKAKEIGWIP